MDGRMNEINKPAVALLPLDMAPGLAVYTGMARSESLKNHQHTGVRQDLGNHSVQLPGPPWEQQGLELASWPG